MSKSRFRAHFIDQEGNLRAEVVHANSPEQVSELVRGFGGVRITKIKSLKPDTDPHFNE